MKIIQYLALCLTLLATLSGCGSTPAHPKYKSIEQEELAKESAYINTPEKIRERARIRNWEERNSIYRDMNK
jgi:hypothetical protein